MLLNLVHNVKTTVKKKQSAKKEEAKKESPGEIATPICPHEDTSSKPVPQPNEAQVSSTGGKY